MQAGIGSSTAAGTVVNNAVVGGIMKDLWDSPSGALPGGQPGGSGCVVGDERLTNPAGLSSHMMTDRIAL